MIEKMSLLNIVAKKEDLDSVFKKILISDDFHQIDGKKGLLSADIEKSELPENFFSEVRYEEIDKSHVDKHFKMVNKLMQELSIEPEILSEVIEHTENLTAVYQKIENMYDKLVWIDKRKENLLEEKVRLERIGAIEDFEGIDFDIKKLKDLNNFNVYVGVFGIEEEKRMNMNYENLQIFILPLGRHRDERLYIVVTPKELENESEAILRSLSFKSVDVDWQLFGTPEQMTANIKKEKKKNANSLKALEYETLNFIEESRHDILMFYSRLKLEYDIIAMKQLSVYTDFYFWFSAYVPMEKLADIKKQFGDDETKIIFIDVADKDLNKANFKIPTRLKNAKIFRPFEMLVNMYGVPSYDEADPTTFVSLSYMLLFGAMFGDIGQGLVIFLIGLFMVKRNKSSGAGALLYSIGASSMIFGFIYDSFFGIEHIISGVVAKLIGANRAETIFIRPIENTNFILLSAIVIGVSLLMISFMFSIFNKLRVKNYKEGLFGKNGINGMVLFASFIAFIICVVVDFGSVWNRVLMTVMVLSVVIFIFREPLGNIVKQQKPLHDEDKKEYYVEGFFELFETILGIISNTASFIRVGAFALNHAGLFIAFHTMADIINNPVGDFSMFILGNVFVIGLEGMIVFIQGLRLVYYEMFSKYFEGEGIEFDSKTSFNKHIERS